MTFVFHIMRLIQNLVGAVKHLSNPTFDGWILEFLFFAKLGKDGVKLYDADNKVEKEWSQSDFRIADPDNKEFPEFPSKGGLWLKPKKWNAGGYDAIYIDKENGSVCFYSNYKSQESFLQVEIFLSFLESFS